MDHFIPLSVPNFQGNEKNMWMKPLKWGGFPQGEHI